MLDHVYILTEFFIISLQSQLSEIKETAMRITHYKAKAIMSGRLSEFFLSFLGDPLQSPGSPLGVPKPQFENSPIDPLEQDGVGM